jgi:hypothetical protein
VVDGHDDRAQPPGAARKHKARVLKHSRPSLSPWRTPCSRSTVAARRPACASAA